jgi:hypothetical protein
VAIVSTVVAFAIWLISRVINVDTEITEELGAKVVEIADKRVPRPSRFLFLAPPAGQLGSIQAEESAMSRRSSARSSRREKVTLDHPIFTRWPAQYPDRLQLFSAPTPNGVKVGIMLEEISLAYEPHRIDIMADESHDPAFLALNPNGKIPAIYDPDGPSGTPLALFESGAILLYLADKTGQFISAAPNTRYETIQ